MEYGDRVRLEDRQGFVDWSYRKISRGYDSGIITPANVFSFLETASHWYYFYQESKLKPFEPDPNDTESDEN